MVVLNVPGSGRFWEETIFVTVDITCIPTNYVRVCSYNTNTTEYMTSIQYSLIIHINKNQSGTMSQLGETLPSLTCMIRTQICRKQFRKAPNVFNTKTFIAGIFLYFLVMVFITPFKSCFHSSQVSRKWFRKPSDVFNTKTFIADIFLYFFG